ncbi:hypothetical protein C8F01DRAFT_1081575 [Mycena amicta]|nr:hypothetical protein C8F01DRAFT_1081575 [Mycena amicta]
MAGHRGGNVVARYGVCGWLGEERDPEGRGTGWNGAVFACESSGTDPRVRQGIRGTALQHPDGVRGGTNACLPLEASRGSITSSSARGTIRGRDTVSPLRDSTFICRCGSSYYYRALVATQLMPLLEAVSSSRPPAHIMSILGAGFTSAVDLNNLGNTIKPRNGSFRPCLRGMQASHVYTDAWFAHLAATHPALSFTHAHPGAVLTAALKLDLPGILGALLNFTMNWCVRHAPRLIGAVPPSECGEHMVWALGDAERGVELRDRYGDVISRKQFSEGDGIGEGMEPWSKLDKSTLDTEIYRESSRLAQISGFLGLVTEISIAGGFSVEISASAQLQDLDSGQKVQCMGRDLGRQPIGEYFGLNSQHSPLSLQVFAYAASKAPDENPNQFSGSAVNEHSALPTHGRSLWSCSVLQPGLIL